MILPDDINICLNEYTVIVKGSLDEKLPSYEVSKMRENRRVENSRVE